VRVLHALLLAGLLGIGATGVRGADMASDPQRENQLRAGYLLNFIKFVEWPQGTATTPWNLCFSGAEGVRQVIENSPASRQNGARAIAVRALSRNDSAAGCHLLYVDAAAPDVNERLASLDGLPILTVSDAHGFAHSGGVVELFTEGNRLRFDINLYNARRVGLRVSSSLLQLASHVEETGR
jgi:hypothetical protein